MANKYRARDDREREERQKKVYNLRLVRHWEVDDIARHLGVVPMTIYRDLAEIRSRFTSSHGKDVSDKMEIVAMETLSLCNALIKRLWEVADKDKNPMATICALREIRETLKDTGKMMEQYGVYKPSKSDDGMETLADMLMHRTRSNLLTYGQT